MVCAQDCLRWTAELLKLLFMLFIDLWYIKEIQSTENVTLCFCTTNSLWYTYRRYTYFTCLNKTMPITSDLLKVLLLVKCNRNY